MNALPSHGQAPSDVCLLLEGTYPYVSGGVSAWVHDLIKAQSHLTFDIVAIVPDHAERKRVYEVPPNVRSVSHVALNALPPGAPGQTPGDEVIRDIAQRFAAFIRSGGLSELTALAAIVAPLRGVLGQQQLLNSPSAFRALSAIYEEMMPDASFLHFFWSWRALSSAFFAAMLAPLPPSRVYHAISTGYAGLMAARGRIEMGRPALLTEHGIYTNERRIEVALAEWLHDPGVSHLGLEKASRDLKDLWTDAFTAFSRAIYQVADQIITLYRGNQDMQIADGAPVARLSIIPNGVDYARFSRLTRPATPRPPTVALIGRVVPIKDIKTYLRAVAMAKSRIPHLRALVMGPDDEDPDYARECRELAAHLGLGDTLSFTGRVKLDDYLPHIDLNVLTSVSEAQPLVLLEVGAAGIASIATDVGSCAEIILGKPDETPALGRGGAIVPLASPLAVADAMCELLMNPARLAAAGQAMRERVLRHYNKPQCDAAYRGLYETHRRAPWQPILEPVAGMVMRGAG